MKALKIIGVAALVLWMAWITFRLEQIAELARYACAASVAKVLDSGMRKLRDVPDPYTCPWQDYYQGSIPRAPTPKGK